jgi:hypothetical protein
MSTQHTKRVIRIATIGVEDRTRRTLDVVFKGPGEGAYVLVEEGLAESIIFDFDCFNAAVLWEDYRKRHPKLPTLVISVNHKEIPDTVFLRKPIQISSLFQTLGEIKERMDALQQQAEIQLEPPKLHAHTGTVSDRPATIPSRFQKDDELDRLCGSVADVNLENGQDVQKIFYNPYQYFQGVLDKALRTAIENDTGVLISGMPQQIVLLPKNNRMLCASPDHELKALCLVPVQQRLITISLLNATDANTQALRQRVEQSLQHGKPLDQFIWKVALWTARGHIPTGTDLQQPVRLSRWPNLTRLLLTPYSLQIASLWHKRTYSLLETAKVLDIPQRYVFTFYSGARALHLIKITPSDTIDVTTPKQDTKQQAFFHRLLSKIWGKSGSQRVTT